MVVVVYSTIKIWACSEFNIEILITSIVWFTEEEIGWQHGILKKRYHIYSLYLNIFCLIKYYFYL